MRQVSKIICPKHGIPALPSRAKRGWTQCKECKKEIRDKSKEKRGKKWDNEFIGCIKHPETRITKAFYIYDGKRKCRRCITTSRYYARSRARYHARRFFKRQGIIPTEERIQHWIRSQQQYKEAKAELLALLQSQTETPSSSPLLLQMRQ